MHSMHSCMLRNLSILEKKKKIQCTFLHANWKKYFIADEFSFFRFIKKDANEKREIFERNILFRKCKLKVNLIYCIRNGMKWKELIQNLVEKEIFVRFSQ